ncbi:TPA: glycosyltransferase family 4 protein, partial [Escherichia coli]|nr:glycosyltransferase family 4 protein [Escherichia coli]
MFVFFAKHPGSNPNQGMHHRILAIDNIVRDKERKYVHVSFFKNLRRKITQIDAKTTQYEFNFFIHFFIINKILSNASIIYIHTIINGLKACLLFNKKTVLTILDAHGVVPEESKMNNEVIKKHVFSLAEKMCFRKVDYIIHVSNAMKEHFDNKYSNRKNRDIILPIFGKMPEHKSINANEHDYILFCYVGGTQKWQNFDDVFAFAINTASPNYRFHFMIPSTDIKKYIEMIPQSIKEYIIINNGGRNEVYDLLQRADFGFLLRDDVLVNNVACPTKAIEYLHFDVIPIVKNNHIGDLNVYGVETLLFSNMECVYMGQLNFEKITKHNKLAYKKMLDDTNK